MDEQARERIVSGVPGFDKVTGGGLLAGRLHLVKGAPGTGKTVLANQLCFHGAGRGLRVVYVTLMTELHGRLVSNLSSFAFFDASLVGQGLQYLSLTAIFREGGFAGLSQALRAIIRQHQPAVVVLDGFLPLEVPGASLLPVSMFLQDLEALSTLVGTTLLLTDSTPAGVHAPAHVLVDAIIELEEALLEGRARRTLRIRKWRGGRHLGGLHPFTIDSEGLRVSPHLPPGDRRAPEPNARPREAPR